MWFSITFFLSKQVFQLLLWKFMKQFSFLQSVNQRFRMFSQNLTSTLEMKFSLKHTKQIHKIPSLPWILTWIWQLVSDYKSVTSKTDVPIVYENPDPWTQGTFGWKFSPRKFEEHQSIGINFLKVLCSQKQRLIFKPILCAPLFSSLHWSPLESIRLDHWGSSVYVFER